MLVNLRVLVWVARLLSRAPAEENTRVLSLTDRLSTGHAGYDRDQQALDMARTKGVRRP